MVRTVLKEISLDFGTILKLQVVSDIDELLTKVTCDDDIPFWAELWPSAIGLARYIWHNENLSGRRVLELGAGIGLSGMAAALKGGQVLQTDFVPQALELAAENARLNSLVNLSQQKADWRDFPLEEKFDLIIGSDILYEPTLHPFIFKILQQNLLDSGTVLLADPGRKFAGDFLQALPKCWRVFQSAIEVEERSKNYFITIYNLQKDLKENPA